MDDNKKKRLDLEILKSKKSKIVSMEDALKDVEPIEWTEDVIEGKKKVLIKQIGQDK